MTLVSQSGRAVATTALSLANNSQTLMDLSNDPAFKTALPTGACIGALIVSSSAAVSAIALGDDFGPFYAMPVMAGRTETVPVSAVTPTVTVSAITPEVGSAAGGTSVTVTGFGFAAGASVTVGGIQASAVTFVDSYTLKVTTPAHPATPAADVVVTNPGGDSATLANAFDYEPAPTVIYFNETFENG